MSAAPIPTADPVLARPQRRLAALAASLILATTIAGSFVLATVLPDSGKSGAKIERPAHAPGPNGELRPT